MLFRLVTLLLACVQVAFAGVKCKNGKCPWWLRIPGNSCCGGTCWVARPTCSFPGIGGMSDSEGAAPQGYQIQDKDIPRLKAEAAAKLIGGMSQPQAMNMIAEMLDVVVDKDQPKQGGILGSMTAGAAYGGSSGGYGGMSGGYGDMSGGHVGAMSQVRGFSYPRRGYGGMSGGHVGAMSQGHGVSYPHSMCKYQSTKDGCNYFGCNNLRCPCMWEATFGVPGGRCMISDHPSNYDYPYRG